MKQMFVLAKTKCFYDFIHNSKSNQNFNYSTQSLRHSLTAIHDTKLKIFQCGFFELEKLKIFTKAFLKKIIIRA